MEDNMLIKCVKNFTIQEVISIVSPDYVLKLGSHSMQGRCNNA